MGFFYGNISNHIPRTNFKFTKIFPNRLTMHEVVEENSEDSTQNQDFGLNKYFLIDYSSGGKDSSYLENVEIDEKEYGAGNFDYTVWQSQLIDENIKCIAIARLHSVLPTFETLDSYQIDILEPISGADYFGRGKNYQSLSTITNIPILQKIYICDKTKGIDIIKQKINELFPKATIFSIDLDDKLFEIHISNIEDKNGEEEPDLEGWIQELDMIMQEYLPE